jgi:hypothetical protein
VISRDDDKIRAGEHRSREAVIGTLVGRVQRAEHQRDELAEAVQEALAHLVLIGPLAYRARVILHEALEGVKHG